MTPILATLKKSSRAAVIALALGAASFAGAMPAQAQATFNFQLGLDDRGNAFSFGMDAPRRRGGFNINRCLTNNQVRQGLRDFGFRDVDIIRNLNRNRVLVEASYRRFDYRMRVNKCSGQVTDIDRVRNFDRDRDYDRGRGGFGLQFNF